MKRLEDISQRDWLDAIQDPAHQYRSLATSPDSAGGFLTHPFNDGVLRESAIRESLVVADVTVRQVTDGNTQHIARTTDLEPGERVAEGAPSTEKDILFATSVVPTDKYTSKYIDVSVELFNDAPDVWLSILAARINRAISFDIFTGVNAVTGVESLATEAATINGYDNLKVSDVTAAFIAMNPAYYWTAKWWFRPELVVSMADGTGADEDFEKIISYIGLDGRATAHLLAIRMEATKFLPELAAGKGVIYLADWSRYELRRTPMVLAVDTESQAEDGIVRLLAWVRAGGTFPVTEPTNSEALIKISGA